jgi:rRNA maturation RNase YbeY
MVIQIHQLPDEIGLKKTELRKICIAAAAEIGVECRRCDMIFVNDAFIRKIHAEYLNDPSPTDVITFNVGDATTIEAEIYICPDTAREQALYYGVSLQSEIIRLMIHGLLHLYGFDDNDEPAQRLMREQEDRILKNVAQIPGLPEQIFHAVQ